MLITGVSGLLGNNLACYFRNKYEVLGLHNTHRVIIKGIYTERCNILDNGSIRAIISDFTPSIIIHCASLTNIDQCETDKHLTQKINVLSTKAIVESITDRNVKLIYISTDAVYDGIKGNFSETDNINPQNYYGASKYEGEIETLKNKDALILRTNIFGWNIQDKMSIGEWILDELRAKRKINCFKDAFFSSIYTIELSRVIDIAIQNGLRGVYNCGGSNSYSKYEFALKIADCFGLDKTLIMPISIDNFGFKAKRGKNLSLNSDKLQRELSYSLPAIEQSIEEFYKDYKCGLPEEIKQGQKPPQKEYFFIPYGRHWIDENDIHAVVRTLRSERLTQGPLIEKFEQALAEYCGAKYAVAVNSGTSALHIACLAAGIKDGDEVITSPVTFVASANCVLYCGGKPVFADIGKDTYNIDTAEIRKRINSKTKAIISVHFAGLPCDMETIKKIADEYDLKIIEDACHALGAEWLDSNGKWNKTGSCSHSDMTVFSFHPVKHITTGEGGAILTNNAEIYERLLLLRNHGITKNPSKFINKDLAFSHSFAPNPWYYEMQELGFNFRITDMQCALGLSQLKKIEPFLSRRHEIAVIYNEALKDNKYIKTSLTTETRKSAYHLYTVQIDFLRLGKSRLSVMNELTKKGIGTQVHYIPVHLQPYYMDKFGYRAGDYPAAEGYYSKTLSLPLYSKMSDADVENVIDCIVSEIR